MVQGIFSNMFHELKKKNRYIFLQFLFIFMCIMYLFFKFYLNVFFYYKTTKS